VQHHELIHSKLHLLYVGITQRKTAMGMKIIINFIFFQSHFHMSVAVMGKGSLLHYKSSNCCKLSLI